MRADVPLAESRTGRCSSTGAWTPCLWRHRYLAENSVGTFDVHPTDVGYAPIAKTFVLEEFCLEFVDSEFIASFLLRANGKRLRIIRMLFRESLKRRRCTVLLAKRIV